MQISSSSLNIKVEKYKSKTMQLISKIDALSPLKTLSRGYSVAQKEDGKVVKSINDVNINESLKLTLTDGKIDVLVK